MSSHATPRPRSAHRAARRMRTLLSSVVVAVVMLGASLASPVAASAAVAASASVASGVMSGTVYTDNPLPEGDDHVTQVSLYNVADLDTVVTKITIDSSGIYQSYPVPVGSYIVQLSRGNSDGTLVQWYSTARGINAALTRDKASVIQITAGHSLQDIDMYLQTPSSITGTVTGGGASGTLPIVNLKVAVYDANGMRVASGLTLREGNYRVSSIPAGKYFVRFDPDDGSDFVPQWLGGKPTIYGSTRVTVPERGVTERVNAVLAARPPYVAPDGADPIPFSSVAAPVITGFTYVRGVLHATSGSSSPSARVLQYQWLRNGVAIPGATIPVYTLLNTDAGSTFSFRVTGTRDGYIPSVSTSKPTAMITGGVFNTHGNPEIMGTFEVGNTLSVSTKLWEPAPTTSLYQWFRNGVAVPGATNPAYALTLADAGTRVEVIVTGVRAGFKDYAISGNTFASGDIPAVAVTSPTPRIVGTGKVGNTLTVTTFTWAPAPVTLTYAWYRGASRIPGATKASYKLVESDRGKPVTVAVTGSGATFNPVTTISKARTIR